MKDQCNEKMFLDCVKNHKMTIVKNDGLHRHIRFGKPGDTNGQYDIVSWPGHLCVTGDYGSYLFSRIPDMFEFFRIKPQCNAENLHINPGYWSEKLLATSTFGDGHREFDIDKFKSAVMEYYKDHCEGKNSKYRRKLWEELKDRVLDVAEEKYSAIAAINNFDHDDFDFTDFWEHITERYTFHFIWCLYAIAWGIQQYDSLENCASKY